MTDKTHICQGCGAIHDDVEVETEMARKVGRDEYREPGVSEIVSEWTYWECEVCHKKHRINGIDPTTEDPELRAKYSRLSHRRI